MKNLRTFPAFSTALFLLTAATPALFAGGTSTTVIVVPFEGQRSTAIALVQPADYLCVTVAVSSREKDPARQADDVRAGVRALAAAVEKSPHLQLHQGPLRFFAGGGGKLFSSSNYGSTSQLSTNSRVLYRLAGSGSDTFAGTTAVRQLVEGLRSPGMTDLHVVGVTLAVDSPERHRERLLSLIRDSADSMKKTFNADQVTIGGLDGPVLVRQVDDESVELFIDYQLSVTAGK